MRKKSILNLDMGKYQCSIVRTITQENRSNFECNEKPIKIENHFSIHWILIRHLNKTICIQNCWRIWKIVQVIHKFFLFLVFIFSIRKLVLNSERIAGVFNLKELCFYLKPLLTLNFSFYFNAGAVKKCSLGN